MVEESVNENSLYRPRTQHMDQHIMQQT